MTLWVVRHGSAGDKANWDGDDALRPLDADGLVQADRVADLLAPRRPRRLRSSPTTRCTATLAPLAARLGLAVDEEDDLGPEGDPDRLLGLLARTGTPADVVCTHGELLRPALRALRDAGAVADPGGRDLLAKGGVWELDLAVPRLVLL